MTGLPPAGVVRGRFQLILTALIVRLRCVRLGIVMHILTNSSGMLAALFGVLT